MSKYTKSIKGKLFQYFNQKLKLKNSTGGWKRCDCPYCGGSHTFGINISTNKVHCFKCELRKTPVEVLMHFEKFDTLNQVWEFINIQQEYDRYIEVAQEKYEKKQVEFPKSFKLITDKAKSILGMGAYNYLTKQRGFSLKLLRMKSVGYCDMGEYAGYIVFPYFRAGVLKFFQGRIYAGAGPKMQNPKKEDFGIGKTEVIYNEDALYIYRKIYILESITNCLTMGDRAVGLSGKTRSTIQLNKLLNSPVEEYTIILDKDAYNGAILLALELVQYKKVRIVKMPTDDDVNKIGKKATLALVKETEPLSYMQILMLKAEYEKTSIITHN